MEENLKSPIIWDDARIIFGAKEFSISNSAGEKFTRVFVGAERKRTNAFGFETILPNMTSSYFPQE